MKQLFVIKVDHSIDLITNSSSELFVLEGKSLDTVKELIASIYPEYLTEYDEVKPTSELTTDELEIYIDYSRRDSVDILEDEREFFVNEVDPDKKMYFLFSKHQNPDFDKQEELERIAQRYHLG
jgi:hypothetical protein